ncbi:hypothetical protein NHF48_019840 [Sphingomonas sp. H160509]|uniref:hypothetical protein n=1 Tax=Sphingomonas sp. H160509 TaxID=2955313 RepID=UPI0020976860|nr:hypothetical protein [Sphingomonas sp. H160509]MDD1452671.1 hypothetical protein [Sphingomonas sp. H160509]
MPLISHDEAARLLDALSGDPETIAALSTYIASQAALERWDAATVGRTAAAAERRSTEAMHRNATFAADLRSVRDRIDELEASNRDLADVLAALLRMIDGD